MFGTYDLQIYFENGEKVKFVISEEISKKFLEWISSPKGKFIIDNYELEKNEIKDYLSEYEWRFLGNDFTGYDTSEYE